MRIGVDCDGVLTDLSAYIFDRGERYFGHKVRDTSFYNVEDIFQCTKKEGLRFWLRYFFPYCKCWPPRTGAVEVINRLHAEGHRLYEITARMFVTEKNPFGWYSRRVFLNWIKKYGFPFEDIFFCAEKHSAKDKLAGCRKYAVEVMIDDKPDVAIYLAEHGIRVLLFDTLYNQGLEHDNMIRVYDWKDIEQRLQELDCDRVRGDNECK